MRIAYQQPPLPLPSEPALAQEVDARTLHRTSVDGSPPTSNTIWERMAKYRQVASPESYEKEQRRLREEEEWATARAASGTVTGKVEAPGESKPERYQVMSLEERMEALRQNSSRHAFERRLQSKKEVALQELETVVKTREMKQQFDDKEENARAKEKKEKRMYAPSKPTDLLRERRAVFGGLRASYQSTNEAAVMADMEEQEREKSRPADMPNLSPNVLQERGAAFGGLRGSHQSAQSNEEAELFDVEEQKGEKPRPADMPMIDTNLLKERMGTFTHRSELSANTRDEGGIKGRPVGALNSSLKLIQERMDAFSHRPEQSREDDTGVIAIRPADMPELDPNLLQERKSIFSHRSGPDAVIEAGDVLSNRPPPSAKIEDEGGAAAQKMMVSDDVHVSVQDPLPNLDDTPGAKPIDPDPTESKPMTSPTDSLAVEVALEENPEHAMAVTTSSSDIEEGSRPSVPLGLHVSNADKSMVDSVDPAGFTGRSEEALKDDKGFDAVASLADDCEPERMEEGWPCDAGAHRTAITTAILDNVMASDERSSDEDTSDYASDTQLDASLSTWPGCHSLLSKEYSNFLAYLDSPDTDNEGPMSAAHDVELHNTANGVVAVRRMDAINPPSYFESPLEQAVVFMGASNACSVEITTVAGRDVNQAQSSSESTPPSVRNDTSPGASVKGNGQPSIIPWYYRRHHRQMFVALPLVIVVLLLVVIVLAVSFARK